MKKQYLHPALDIMNIQHEELICASLGSEAVPTAFFNDAETVDNVSADVKTYHVNCIDWDDDNWQ